MTHSSLSVGVLVAILCGALLHATWNVLVKRAPVKLVATAGVALGAALLSAVVLPLLPAPASQSWPYLAASVVVELIYGVLLAAAYRVGDLGHAYPLMRGAAPLLVALASGPLIAEQLSRIAWIGVGTICAGIFCLIADARSRGPFVATSGFALLNAVVIASYTIIDGLGVRASGSAVAYTMWIFLLTGVPWLVWLARRHWGTRWVEVRGLLPLGLIGGACSLGSYGIALWAMTQAPVAIVAAVRETSIVFGSLLGVWVLHERFTLARALSATVILFGIAVVRLR
jgi:drug/metabolite transporter (DMT)-like permease